MFFVKAGFWILVIILLLPSNGQERYDLYATAQRTVADIGSFCTRNPDVCEKTSSAASGALNKLKTAAESIEDMLRDAGIGARREIKDDAPQDRERQGQLDGDPRMTTSSMAGNTLKPDDLRPSWRGPGI